MLKEINYHNNKISYSDEGHGDIIIFLHGFLESCDIWKNATDALSDGFRIIAIDLPGHGRSDVIAGVHTMDMMADSVHAVLESLGIEKCLIVGHSMGGYVSLSFAEKYPEMIRGLCLFHSHSFPDSETAKVNRDKTIKIVQSAKTDFILGFIPDLFSPANTGKYSAEINELVKNASSISKEGIIAALKGMKVRVDKMHVLSEAGYPVLFIAGKDDKRISLNNVFTMAALPDHSEVMILGNTGHMGHIEQKEKTIRRIRAFAVVSFLNE